MKEKLKNQRAITLIALVVTIVVLLILAGITINMVFSNNGVIKQAQDAKNVQENAQAKDQEAVENIMSQAEYIMATKYTVTFDTDGGSTIPSQTVVSEAKATKPATDPSKEGYTFKGWYTTSTGSTQFDFNNQILNNTTIYAKWELKWEDRGLNLIDDPEMVRGGDYALPAWIEELLDDGCWYVAFSDFNPLQAGYPFVGQFFSSDYSTYPPYVANFLLDYYDVTNINDLYDEDKNLVESLSGYRFLTGPYSCFLTDGTEIRYSEVRR